MQCLPFRFKFGTVALSVQLLFAILFASLIDYDAGADPKLPKKWDKNQNSDNVTFEEVSQVLTRKYPAFQDVHVMIFVGFGFLMTFLGRFGFSAVGLNLWLSALILQWAMIVRAIISKVAGATYAVSLSEMVSADFAAATVLISFGAVLGKTSPLQLLVMGMIEVIVAQINGYICHEILHAADVGESMYIHAFGAYFGLAVSRVLYNEKVLNSKKADSNYISDLFAMIGTLFLWLYWPSFNGGGADGDEQHRAFINTYLSLCACTVVTFGLSAILNKSGKFTMVFVQNATLAGGVAVGTVANMPIQPYGAIVMGSLAGIISVVGYEYLTNFLEERLRIQDTCGVHNLHGMPALLAAVAGTIMAFRASNVTWGRSVYEIFPQMVPKRVDTLEWMEKYPDLTTSGGDWESEKQAIYQLLALNVTLAISIVCGILTGLLLKLPVFDQITDTDGLFEDAMFWNLPESEEEKCNGENNAKELSLADSGEPQPNGKEESKGDDQV